MQGFYLPNIFLKTLSPSIVFTLPLFISSTLFLPLLPIIRLFLSERDEGFGEVHPQVAHLSRLAEKRLRQKVPGLYHVYLRIEY